MGNEYVFLFHTKLLSRAQMVQSQIVQITNRIARDCFTLGPNPNFFTFHVVVFVAQIWRQNFGLEQGNQAKVFLGPNYKTLVHMKLGPKMGQKALYCEAELIAHLQNKGPFTLPNGLDSKCKVRLSDLQTQMRLVQNQNIL